MSEKIVLYYQGFMFFKVLCVECLFFSLVISFYFTEENYQRYCILRLFDCVLFFSFKTYQPLIISKRICF